MKATTRVIMDPTGHILGLYGHSTDTTEHAIRQECGLLIEWAVKRDPDSSIREALEGNYQFGIHEMDGGTVNEEGVYSYPEDPDLYPLVSMTDEMTGEVVYIYSYGIVAFTDPDEDTFVTRMD